MQGYANVHWQHPSSRYPSSGNHYNNYNRPQNPRFPRQNFHDRGGHHHGYRANANFNHVRSTMNLFILNVIY